MIDQPGFVTSCRIEIGRSFRNTDWPEFMIGFTAMNGDAVISEDVLISEDVAFTEEAGQCD